MRIIYYLILTLLALFPFGQITRIPIGALPSVRVYMHDVVVVLIAIALIVLFVKNPKSVVMPPLIKHIVLFVSIGVISLIANSGRFELQHLLIGSLYLVRWSAYVAVYIAVYNLIAHKILKRVNAIRYLLYAGVTTAVFGLVQYMLYPNLRNLMYLGWDPHEYRVFGTFFDSGFIGLILTLALILIMPKFFNQKDVSRRPIFQFTGSLPSRLMGLISLIAVYASLALTYSRSSYLSLLIVFFIFSLLKKSVIPFALALVVLTATIFLLPQPSPTAEGTNLARTTSSQARLTNADQSIQIITDNPIFGVGFNMLRYENRDRNFVPDHEWRKSNAAAGLDNSFLFVFATTGILGLASYLIILSKIFIIAFKQQAIEKTKKWGILIILSLSAVIVHSIFNNSLFYPWIIIWMWVLLGVTHVSRDLSRVTR